MGKDPYLDDWVVEEWKKDGCRNTPTPWTQKLLDDEAHDRGRPLQEIRQYEKAKTADDLERYLNEYERMRSLNEYERMRRMYGIGEHGPQVDPEPPLPQTQTLGVGVSGRRICPCFIICEKPKCQYYKPGTTKDIAITCHEIKEDIVLEDIE